MTELQNCPCCGKKARLIRKEGFGPAGAKFSRGYVTCNGCGVTTPTKSPWEKAVKIWNSRAANYAIATASTTPPTAVEPVAVKPLEWVDGAPGTYTEIAASPFGYYSVWEINGTGCWAPWKQGSGTIAEGGLAGAKAAAQADYETRIRSALATPSTDLREENERLQSRAAEKERLRFEGDLDKWMKIIGAGITGFQPEAYAVMDDTCHEFVRMREENERLKEELSEWKGRYHRMVEGLKEADDMAATLSAENAALRQIISYCASAIGNGAFASPDCSVEFMQGIPNEMRLHSSALKERLERVEGALKALLSRDERNTCTHEDTHRGGFLWEICGSCGAKWADDEGGKPKWDDPPEWVAARAALAREGK